MNLYALALLQQDMESRRAKTLVLESEVNRLKVLYMHSFINGAISFSE